MLINRDSIILHSTRLEEHQLGICIFLRPSMVEGEGLFVRLEMRGIEFFKELPTLSPEDDLHSGVYRAIENLPQNVSQAIKEFTGIELPQNATKGIYPSILFSLLYELKYQLSVAKV